MTLENRTASLQRQRGNTLTGLIIGLIVGLAIAVAVALAITKGATPFTEKSAKGKPAEPTAGQVSDPNRPLYGNKDAAREANKQFTEKPKEADPDPLGKVIAGLKDPADLKAEGKPAPAAEPAAAEPARAHPRADEAAAEEKTTYYLQAGAFREMAEAENARARLALLGFEAAITDRSNESGVLHRVRVGPYSQVETMNKARAKLIDSGVDVAIVRNQK